MAVEIKNNMFLINAPAGSGKTTTIRNYLKSIFLNEPQSKVLCITYTNRAADELKKDLISSNITVSTIHSYINDLIKPFLSQKESLRLYWEIYGQRVEERIKNTNEDERVSESNLRYIEKYGDLTVNIVKENLSELSYGETPFTSLYYGKLSHDDLLMFTCVLVKKYPIILKKISGKFKYIFIDEYQDTSAYVLELFYAAVKGKNNVELYLLGDRMQQIYNNYDGSFEDKFKEFESLSLKTNFRSVEKIISILNKIYNDSAFNQDVSEENLNVLPDVSPRIILSSNVKETVENLQNDFPDILTLYLMNREKYEEIGAINLYKNYSKMEAYSFGRKYTPVEVLSDISDDNPDKLMSFLFFVDKIMQLYSNENYGVVISSCKSKPQFFNLSSFRIQCHTDKKQLKEKLDRIRFVYESEESSVQSLLASMNEEGVLASSLLVSLKENVEYSSVLDIKLTEVKKLSNYLHMPHISTQHGVKGESHTAVVFVAADGSNPNVKMYSFFELWSSINFSLPELEETYYSYLKDITKLESAIGMKTSDLNSDSHNANKEILMEHSNKILEKYKNNKLFNLLCKKDFDDYLNKQNVSNAKKIFKRTNVEGILAAYKLFYVGCSRARKNLLVVVDKEKIEKFEDMFKAKAKATGFEVV